jgi:hypothetical protein
MLTSPVANQMTPVLAAFFVKLTFTPAGMLMVV